MKYFEKHLNWFVEQSNHHLIPEQVNIFLAHFSVQNSKTNFKADVDVDDSLTYHRPYSWRRRSSARFSSQDPPPRTSRSPEDYFEAHHPAYGAVSASVIIWVPK